MSFAYIDIELQGIVSGIKRMAYTKHTSEAQNALYATDIESLRMQQATVRAEIETLKLELTEVRREREEKKEYDAIAMEILKLQDRDSAQECVDMHALE